MKIVTRIKAKIKSERKYFIVYGILWFVLDLIFIAPIAVSFKEAHTVYGFDAQQFIMNIFSEMASFKSFIKMFTVGAVGTFFSLLWKWTLLFVGFIFAYYVFGRKGQANEYTSEEHGSSDWASRGETYSLLKRKDGILLAKDIYLPTNKMGNINVLVIRRFGFSENLNLMLFLMH